MDSSVSIGNTVIHWYQQSESNTWKWIMYYTSSSKSNTASEFQDRFSGDKNEEENSCTLTIAPLEVSDSATYYCAYWSAHTA
ncbi:VPRE3 protein, partial [Amia calva]|nr:VPRE3 protein [Amia calva]MBN3311215.1 VPRE3 protein [Amia calva]